MAESKAAAKQKARMAAATARRSEPDAPAPGRTAVRTRPVRITIDMNPEAYRNLTEWVARAAEELDVPRLTLADAIRAMAKATELDPGVSAEVLRILRQSRT